MNSSNNLSLEENELETLKKISKKIMIEKELTSLQEKIEEFQIRSDIENKDYSDKINQWKAQQTNLKEERENYLKVKHKIDSFLQDYQKADELLSKLENKFKAKEIKEKIYEKLKMEYTERKNKARKEYLEEYERLKEIMKNSREYIQKHRDNKEEIKARMELGDISQDKGKIKLKKLEETLETNKTVRDAIDNLLKSYSKDSIE